MNDLLLNAVCELLNPQNSYEDILIGLKAMADKELPEVCKIRIIQCLTYWSFKNESTLIKESPNQSRLYQFTEAFKSQMEGINISFQDLVTIINTLNPNTQLRGVPVKGYRFELTLALAIYQVGTSQFGLARFYLDSDKPNHHGYIMSQIYERECSLMDEQLYQLRLQRIKGMF